MPSLSVGRAKHDIDCKAWPVGCRMMVVAKHLRKRLFKDDRPDVFLLFPTNCSQFRKLSHRCLHIRVFVCYLFYWEIVIDDDNSRHAEQVQLDGIDAIICLPIVEEHFFNASGLLVCHCPHRSDQPTVPNLALNRIVAGDVVRRPMKQMHVFVAFLVRDTAPLQCFPRVTLHTIFLSSQLSSLSPEKGLLIIFLEDLVVMSEIARELPFEIGLLS